MLLAPMLTRLEAQQDLRSVLNAALRDVVSLHGAEFGNIRLCDGNGGLVMVAQSRLSGQFAASLGRVDLESGTACARAAREGRTVFVADAGGDPNFAPFLSSARKAAASASRRRISPMVIAPRGWNWNRWKVIARALRRSSTNCCKTTAPTPKSCTGKCSPRCAEAAYRRSSGRCAISVKIRTAPASRSASGVLWPTSGGL
jgi:hypothetical protein